MNKVELIGRLTKDPEVKLTTNQTAYCNFIVAVDRRFKDKDGQRQSDFINCVAWKQTADFINKYFHKGSRIGLCGSIQTRSYEKDGQKVFITEVLVDEVEFVESKTEAKEAAQPKKDSHADYWNNVGTAENTEPQNQDPEEQEVIGNLPFEL